MGRLMSYLRGDRYMVGAYPPEWQERAPAEETAAVGPVPTAPGAQPAVVADAER